LAENTPQFDVCLVELRLARACCHTKALTNFAVGESIDIVQQNYISSRL
jgi:hypothetical protein